MAKRKREDNLADELIKRHEEAENLRRMAGKAAGLASLLTNKPKVDLLRKEVMKRLPVIFMKLNEHKRFIEKKVPGAAKNINKELEKCEGYFNKIEKEISAEKGIEILDWIDKIDEKYGIKSF